MVTSATLSERIDAPAALAMFDLSDDAIERARQGIQSDILSAAFSSPPHHYSMACEMTVAIKAFDANGCCLALRYLPVKESARRSVSLAEDAV